MGDRPGSSSHVRTSEEKVCSARVRTNRQSVQKRLVLVCEGSLCPIKLPAVSGPGLEEAGRYKRDAGGGGATSECTELAREGAGGGGQR